MLTGRSPAHPADSQHLVHSSFSCRCSASRTSSWRPCDLNAVCCAGSVCEKIWNIHPSSAPASSCTQGCQENGIWFSRIKKIIAAFRRTVTAAHQQDYMIHKVMNTQFQGVCQQILPALQLKYEMRKKLMRNERKFLKVPENSYLSLLLP